jgi:hypothetical protein
VHERFHTVEPFALTVRHVEVHWAFLTFLDGKLLAALSPRSLCTARLFCSACQRGDGGRRGLGWPGDASCALTFQPSNHSFIQVF